MPARSAAVRHAVDRSRVRALNAQKAGGGPVAYWMERDQRVRDNWALLYAQELAQERRVPLAVVFGFTEGRFTERQSGFVLNGLQEVQQRLSKLNIPFFLYEGDPGQTVPAFVSEHGIGALVVDYNPLRDQRRWRDAVSAAVACSVEEVDTHNIVPVWEASPKIEYGARTIRSKINSKLGQYLIGFPEVAKHDVAFKGAPPAIDWTALHQLLKAPGPPVAEVAWATPGEDGGAAHLRAFLKEKLKGYGARNDPNAEAQSDLSPWIHFGQLSPQRVALSVKGLGLPTGDFLEELIVRRELTDNFCHYNVDGYDKLEGLYPQFGNSSWAQKTLKDHAKDKREYVYNQFQLETAITHDPLWNAAQQELVYRGKMHGFMRMYWAKKILEWTSSPAEALRLALYFNDHYSLDGCDPNGYVGCAWAIAGLHDQGWAERPVFGKIRFMNFQGCKRKFDVDKYIARMGKIAAAGKKVKATTATKEVEGKKRPVSALDMLQQAPEKPAKKRRTAKA